MEKTKYQIEEAELIALAQKDQSHFGALYNHYFDQIFRFVFKRLGGDEANTGDITQQTFMKALVNIKKYENRGLPFSSWLYRIAQNEINLFFRRNKSQKEIGVDVSDLNIIMTEMGDNQDGISEENQEKLINAINELEKDHADLIELRFFLKVSFKEIADIYSISEANAKMRVYRILEKMNKNWKKG